MRVRRSPSTIRWKLKNHLRESPKLKVHSATPRTLTVALAAKAGVDAAQLAPALAGGFADSLPLQILAPRMASSSFEPVQWKVQTLLKDLDNAVALAKDNTSSTPITALAAQLLRLHAAQGASLEDLSSVVKLFKTP